MDLHAFMIEGIRVVGRSKGVAFSTADYVPGQPIRDFGGRHAAFELRFPNSIGRTGPGVPALFPPTDNARRGLGMAG